MQLWMLIAYMAAIGVWFRFSKFWLKKNPVGAGLMDKDPLVSIVIPVRNEAHSLPDLLNSLMQLLKVRVEIIVVDDGSVDNTKEVAGTYPVKVIESPCKPGEWNGKSWACHVGAQAASGKYLLFTDADTFHYPNSLQESLFFLWQTGSDMVSVSGFHANKLWWEKLLGPFYCLVHAGASPYDRLSTDNPYAVGQYLLIKKDFYKKIGGHEPFRHALADDTSLARSVMKNNGIYKIYNAKPLFDVQMYSSFVAFCRGWQRILRLGMGELRSDLGLQVLLPILALNTSNLTSMTVAGSIPVISTLVCFAIVQRKLGRFSIAGILLFPFPVLFFLVLASTALLCNLVNAPVSWRGRKYVLRKTHDAQNIIKILLVGVLPYL